MCPLVDFDGDIPRDKEQKRWGEGGKRTRMALKRPRGTWQDTLRRVVSVLHFTIIPRCNFLTGRRPVSPRCRLPARDDRNICRQALAQ